MRTGLMSVLARPKPPPFALGLLVAALLIAAETQVLLMLHGVAHQYTRGLIYLIGVLIVSTVWGVWLGVVTSLASAVAFNYFHILPFRTLKFPAGQDLQHVAIFIAAALLVSTLADMARSGIREGSERRREADLAAGLARLLLGASDLRSALGTASRQVAYMLDLPSARIELEAVHGDAHRTAFPLRDSATVLGTVVVPADLSEHTLERLRQRVVPSLESLLRAARDREVMTNSLNESRKESATLAEEQAALRRVATLVARGAAPTEVFQAVAQELSRLLNRHEIALIRYEPDGTATIVADRNDPDTELSVPVEGDSVITTVLRTGHAARMDDYNTVPGPIAERARRAGIHSSIGVPIVVEGRLWGLAVVVSSTTEALPADAETRMADFTELVATAIANADSRAQLTASRARIVAASDEARRRIERDLHNGAQQRLVALALKLRMMETSTSPHDPMKEQLSQAVDTLTAVFEELQEISRGIHPAILSKGGLGPAIRTLARRCTTPVQLNLNLDRRLPDQVEVGAYYVVSEALTNVVKHAKATVVHVDAEADEKTLRLSIRDNGVGGANTTGGSGLIGLRDRVETLGGDIDIDSPAGRGTQLLVTIPADAT